MICFWFKCLIEISLDLGTDVCFFKIFTSSRALEFFNIDIDRQRVVLSFFVPNFSVRFLLGPFRNQKNWNLLFRIFGSVSLNFLGVYSVIVFHVCFMISQWSSWSALHRPLIMRISYKGRSSTVVFSVEDVPDLAQR